METKQGPPFGLTRRAIIAGALALPVCGRPEVSCADPTAFETAFEWLRACRRATIQSVLTGVTPAAFDSPGRMLMATAALRDAARAEGLTEAQYHAAFQLAMRLAREDCLTLKTGRHFLV